MGDAEPPHERESRAIVKATVAVACCKLQAFVPLEPARLHMSMVAVWMASGFAIVLCAPFGPKVSPTVLWVRCWSKPISSFLTAKIPRLARLCRKL